MNEVVMQDRIGVGSWGEVYLATRGNIHVAVKTLFKHKINATNIQLLKDEVVMLESLNHNNIINLYGSLIEEDGMMAMVMEYANKGSLEHWLENKKPMSWARNVGSVDSKVLSKLEIILEIAEGLTYLHSWNPPILHRDLRPANVLLRSNPDGSMTAKLCDFSNAKFLPSELTMTMTGTPAFIAPEIIRGDKCKASVDVYAFGCILWCLEVGQPMPYVHELENIIVGGSINQLMQLIGHEGLRPALPGSDAEWSGCISDMFVACMNDSPSERPSASEIVTIIKSDMGRGMWNTYP